MKTLRSDAIALTFDDKGVRLQVSQRPPHIEDEAAGLWPDVADIYLTKEAALKLVKDIEKELPAPNKKGTK